MNPDENSVARTQIVSIPAFLTQSYADLRKKFQELEWIQRGRVSAGILAGDASHKWALESSPEIKARNRYMNVQAWANSRIHLKVPEGQCDFINASPIVLKDSRTQGEVRYIATQGPKEGQVAHFWNMIYYETGEVAVVIMLTQILEGGKEKCTKYFPLDMEAPTLVFSPSESDPFVDHGNDVEANKYLSGTVTLLESSYDEKSRSEIRKFDLALGSESKIVWHFFFGGWSDYTKPEGEDREALLHLTTLTAEKSASPDNPRIVHCSAGVGRTGTFIALDHLLRELRSGKLFEGADATTDPVFETVNQLREQRMMMVYNDSQFQFLYEVLKEQALVTLNPDTVVTSPSSDDGFEPNIKAELKPIDEVVSAGLKRLVKNTSGLDNEP